MCPNVTGPARACPSRAPDRYVHLLPSHSYQPHSQTLLEDNAPYQAKVTFDSQGASSGWNAPDTAPWFASALNQASLAHFNSPVGYIGQGGTIPLMNLLSEGFPTAQMMVCGVLGPKSNAHGPNEFLHIPYAKKLTAAVAQVILNLP